MVLLLTHMQSVDIALVLVDALQVHTDHDAVLWNSLDFINIC